MGVVYHYLTYNTKSVIIEPIVISKPKKITLKTRNVFAYFIMAICMICASCNKEEKDVVNGIAPVDVHDIEWRTALIESLKPLSPTERKAKLDEVVPRLNTQLVQMLRRNGKDCEIKTITYVFGSGRARQVASGDGNLHNGYFNDQLYAVIKGGACFGDSLMAFVQCFNGVFIIEGENQEVIGTYQPVFTIAAGQGINTYVDYRTSIWLAETFKLTLYKGHGWNPSKIITPEQAYQLESRLAEVPVTVRVFAGDRFDLGAMTYNGKPAP
jgi:hypothetical protein